MLIDIGFQSQPSIPELLSMFELLPDSSVVSVEIKKAPSWKEEHFLFYTVECKRRMSSEEVNDRLLSAFGEPDGRWWLAGILDQCPPRKNKTKRKKKECSERKKNL